MEELKLITNIVIHTHLVAAWLLTTLEPGTAPRRLADLMVLRQSFNDSGCTDAA